MFEWRKWETEGGAYAGGGGANKQVKVSSWQTQTLGSMEGKGQLVSADVVHERTSCFHSGAEHAGTASPPHLCCHHLTASFSAVSFNACFLCASVLSGDHCLHAPGPESGRSSPYHSQLDVRSSTPTSYQAPKHFHIPGRHCQPASPSMSACSLGVPDA